MIFIFCVLFYNVMLEKYDSDSHYRIIYRIISNVVFDLLNGGHQRLHIHIS